MAEYTYVSGPAQQRRAHGTCAMLAFLFLWLFSLATPLVLAALLLAGATRAALLLAAVAAACYLPVRSFIGFLLWNS
jgi:hypothetical protein